MARGATCSAPHILPLRAVDKDGRGSIPFGATRVNSDERQSQVDRGNAAKYLDGHSGGLSAYLLHFAPKTSKRTIDDLYDLAFAHLMMFSHTAILLSYGPRLPGTELRSFLPLSIAIFGEAC